MKKNIILLSTISSLMLSQSVFSGDMGPIQPLWTPVVTASVGPAWSEGGRTQTFFLQPDLEKTYTANKKNWVLFNGELFVGIQRPLNDLLFFNVNPLILGQIGIAGVGATRARLSGDIWEDANPNFNNFTYSYNVNHGHVAIKGKLLTEIREIIQPYVSGSVGVGFNRAFDYMVRTKLFEEIPAPGFTNHITTAFSYTVGAGIQTPLTNHWQAGIGYEFSDWGNSRLNPAPGQTLNSGLSLNHLYTNQLQFSLSYLA